VEWLESTSWSLAKIEGVFYAVAHAHQLAGFDPPPTAHALVKQGLTAIRRARGRAPLRPKAPITLTELAQLLELIDRATLAGKRDAALLLFAWWGAFRRSEVVALEVADVAPSPGGCMVTIRRSKTDQEGRGAVVGLETKGGAMCPVAALAEWLRVAKITAGPIFRGLTRYGGVRRSALAPQEIARLVKRLALAAGLDPVRFAGHSLRAGFITEAYRQGVPEAQIMATTRHESVDMLVRYRREANPVKQSASAGIKTGRESPP
jgi:integrase